MKEALQKKNMNYLRMKEDQDREHYTRKKNLAKSVVKTAKVKAWENFGKTPQDNYKDNIKKFWTTIRALQARTQSKLGT